MGSRAWEAQRKISGDELKYQTHKEEEDTHLTNYERTAPFMSKRLVTGSAPTATI